MDPAFIIAIRVSLLIATLGVLYAFALAAKDFVLTRKGSDNWLATGVWILALGATLTNGNNLIDVFDGQSETPSVSGLVVLVVGYFLCFAAWWSARYDIPVRKAAVIIAVVVVVISGIAYTISAATL